MTTAIYIRVSTHRQAAENQLPPLQARAPDAVVYEETGSSVKRRPTFDRLMADCRSGVVKHLHIWSLDRLHRNMAQCVNTMLELDRLGIAVTSYREPWLDTASPVRGLLIAMFGWIAEQERAQLIERTRAGQDRARREGKHVGRKPVDPMLVDNACRMVSMGYSISAAARHAGIGKATLQRYLTAA